MLAVEGLNLEAGQLGPVLLFSLMAHGVGYTSSSKVPQPHPVAASDCTACLQHQHDMHCKPPS